MSSLAAHRSAVARWVVAQTSFLERKDVGECIAEAVGTGLIVLFGCGVVFAAAFTGAQVGIWQVAVVWTFGVALAIYTTAPVSGAHLNPAITLAFATWRDFPWRKVPSYIASQLLGAMVGAALNLGIFQGALEHFEKRNGIVRGDPESILSAAAFGEYFPNPYIFDHNGPWTGDDGTATREDNLSVISLVGALLVEAWGTCLLAFVVFAVTDPANKAVGGKDKAIVPLLIGMLVGVNLSLYAPLTQAGWNPARDFGPRVVAALAGWKTVAIPGPRDGFWIYIVGPIIGAFVGGGFYDVVLARSLYAEEDAAAAAGGAIEGPEGAAKGEGGAAAPGGGHKAGKDGETTGGEERHPGDETTHIAAESGLGGGNAGLLSL